MSETRRPCPICKAPSAPRPGNQAFPFCSERCRLIDLGGWLDERYRIPGEPSGDGGGNDPEQDTGNRQ